MSNLKLYYAPGACSVTPHILLREIGADPELIYENLSNHSEGFHLINPKMKVPVLSLDGNLITEIPAILTTISSLAPEKKLMGSTPLEVARVYEWLCWLSGTLHGNGFAGLWRPARFSNDPAVHDGIKAKGKETIKECFDSIERQLTGGVHAVGDSFTGVDAFLFVFYRWGQNIGFNMEAQYPKYTALVSDVDKRESVAAVCEKEGLRPLFPKE